MTTIPDGSRPPRRRNLTPRAQDVVSAASEEFAAHGYAGATTDAIARKAGVSQPYVVRLFGSKEKLFLHCCEQAFEAAQAAFRSAIASTDERPVPEPLLGSAYAELVANPVIVGLLVQQYGLGSHPTLGPAVRAWYVDMFRLLRDEAELPEERARMFFGRGMLINILLTLGIKPDDDPSRELLAYLAPAGQRPPTGS